MRLLNACLDHQADRISIKTLPYLLHAIGMFGSIAILSLGLLGFHLLDRRYNAVLSDHQIAKEFIREASETRVAFLETQQQFEATQQRQHAMLAAIPNDAEEIHFLTQVSELAGRTGLLIRDYRPGVRTKYSTHEAIELILRMEGDYEPLCRFLAGLHQLERRCHVSTCNVSPNSTHDNRLSVELKILIPFALRSDFTLQEPVI